MPHSQYDLDFQMLWAAIRALEKRVAELEATRVTTVTIGPPLEFSAAPGSFEIDDDSCPDCVGQALDIRGEREEG
jgi:hypothetical protein